VRFGTRGKDERCSFYNNDSTGAILPLVAALEALHGLPLQHERVEAVPEISRQFYRVVAQLVQLLDRCAQLPLEVLHLLLSAPVHVQTVSI